MKSIKTVEDAFKVMGVDHSNLPDVSTFPENIRKYILNHFVLLVVVQAINKLDNDGQEWEPNWNDEDEYKYYPWLEVDADEDNTAGSGFSYSCYGSSLTVTLVGSRLCFKSHEGALYAAEQFNDLYVENQLIIK